MDWEFDIKELLIFFRLDKKNPYFCFTKRILTFYKMNPYFYKKNAYFLGICTEIFIDEIT